MGPSTPEQVVRQLRAIPDLAVEVAMTADAPNPSDRAERGSKSPYPPLPTGLDARDVLRPPTDDPIPCEAHVGRDLLVALIRLVVDEMVADDVEPPNWPGDSWVELCGWLISTHAWWVAQDWRGEVDDGVARVHSRLAGLARVPAAVKLQCPYCGDRLRPVDGPWLLCDAGHEIPRVDFDTLRRAEPMTSEGIRNLLGIDEAQLLRWSAAGDLAPIDEDEQPPRWSPLEVVGVIRPDLIGFATEGSVPLAALVEETGVSLRTLQHWAKTGRIRPVGRIGNARTYDPDAVREEARKAA